MCGWLIVLCGAVYMVLTIGALYIDGSLTHDGRENRTRRGREGSARQIRAHLVRSLLGFAQRMRRGMVQFPGQDWHGKPAYEPRHGGAGR